MFEPLDPLLDPLDPLPDPPPEPVECDAEGVGDGLLFTGKDRGSAFVSGVLFASACAHTSTLPFDTLLGMETVIVIHLLYKSFR
jgi:hypothetical protein